MIRRELVLSWQYGRWRCHWLNSSTCNNFLYLCPHDLKPRVEIQFKIAAPLPNVQDFPLIKIFFPVFLYWGSKLTHDLLFSKYVGYWTVLYFRIDWMNGCINLIIRESRGEATSNIYGSWDPYRLHWACAIFFLNLPASGSDDFQRYLL